MVKIDLITGFLGSGKTTFLRKYASYLITQGQNIGILENDFGAVNVDMMLLGDLRGDNCELEMISGGCDADTHRRRFKTKLISMGMCGYDRVIVEPSGIYDVDEFFDTLRDDPLDPGIRSATSSPSWTPCCQRPSRPRQSTFWPLRRPTRAGCCSAAQSRPGRSGARPPLPT